MDLKSLPSERVLEKTALAARDEKRATLALLDLLAEVDARRLYNARGYATLWEYVHKGLGYSEVQASERVSAMRLMRKVPELREELAANRVTLTGAAKLASFVRRENASADQVATLLEKITEKPTREVERILLGEQSVPHAQPDRFKATGPETTRISFDADAEFMALFEELKNGQGRPEWSTADRLKAVMREGVERKRKQAAPKPGRERKTPSPFEKAFQITKASEKPPENEVQERAQEGTVSSGRIEQVLRAHEVKGTRYVSIPVKRRVRFRAKNQCEFIDPETKRRCECRFGLQFDHIIPHAKGGSSNFENIRLLCANHNRYEAIREFGAKKMGEYLRR